MTNKIKISILIITVLLTAISAWSYSVRNKNLVAALGLARDNSGSINIGAVMPLTGQSSMYGEYNREGMDLALAEINNVAGVDGKKLNIIYEDTNSQVSSAVSATQRMIDVNKMPLILTSASSPETLAEAPVAEKGKTVLLAEGSATPKIREAGDYIFRLKVSVDKEVEELRKLASAVFGAKTAYVLYVQNDYGEGIRKSVENIFPSQNLKIVGEEGFRLEETDYRSSLLKIKAADPDIVVLGGWPKNLGYILRRAKELGINKQFIAPAGAIGPDIISIAGPAADGLVYTMEFDIDSQSGATKTFRENFNRRYGKDPELFAAMGYDAVKITAEMLKICGPVSTCIKDNLYKVQNYQGASGAISFDDHGDVLKPMFYMTIKDGKFVKYGG